MNFIEPFKRHSAHEQILEESMFADIKQQLETAGVSFVGDLLARAAKTAPQTVALQCGEVSITYGELYGRVVAFSKILSSNGVVPRDRVLLYCENSIEFYIGYFAVWQIHAVVIPVNIFLHDREMAHIINDALPRVIIAQPQYQETCERLLTNGLVQQLPTVCSAPNLQDVVQAEVAECAKTQPFAEDEMCLLLYTSGTSGVPKGVMLSSRNIMTNTMQSYARFKIACTSAEKARSGESQRFEERFFCVLPLFHVFAQNACIWLPIMTMSTVIVVPKIDRKLILQGLLKEPTIFLGFPALYGLLCLMKNAPLRSIKMFVSGADMLPDKIRLAFAMIYGRRICSGYGLTEASPVIAVNHFNREFETEVVGRPVVGVECVIRDDNGQQVAPGVIGTLWVKGGNIMLGYYKSPDMTAQVLKDGWLCTGDLASYDSNGVLAIRGRSKDLIIHKGFNIYPQEIENVLMKHPQVFKAAVVGLDDAMSGQVPVAYVAVRGQDAGTMDSLRRLCAEHLAVYKIPRKFVCLEDLPMNATGKVDKKVLSKYN